MSLTTKNKQTDKQNKTHTKKILSTLCFKISILISSPSSLSPLSLTFPPPSHFPSSILLPPLISGCLLCLPFTDPEENGTRPRCFRFMGEPMSFGFTPPFGAFDSPSQLDFEVLVRNQCLKIRGIVSMRYI